MNNRYVLILNVLILTGLLVVVFSTGPIIFGNKVFAADKEPASKKTTESLSSKNEKKKDQVLRLIYKPPSRGAPLARVGAGTRGHGMPGTELHVLTPDHTGLTTKAQPTLYWYVSEPVSAHFEFALIKDSGLETVTEAELSAIKESGIQKLSLKDHAVTLMPGVEYQWFVALVSDEKQRSRDIVASGVIKRVQPEQALAIKLDAMASEQQVIAYAKEGLWYDALETISTLIESRPGDHQLREMRASLLDQVGLQDVAMGDRRTAK